MSARKALLFSVSVSMSLGLFACGPSRAKLTPEESLLKKEGVISLDVHWVKDKEEKYDVQMFIRNEAKKSIILKLNEMQCHRGTRQGILRHKGFAPGENVVHFAEGGLRSFLMVCKLGVETKGPYKIVFGNIYDNPSNDAVTVGKSISGAIEWKARDDG